MALAIGVVLIPPDALRDFSISLNELAWKNGKGIRHLNMQENLPHISLALGSIDEKDLSAVQDLIGQAARSTGSILVSVDKFKYQREKKESSLCIQNSPELQRLHEFLVTGLKPLFIRPVQEMFLEPVSEHALSVVERYADDYAFENYWPHITLQCCEAEAERFPEKQRCKELAVFHLGSGCTCKKKLLSIALS
ncbi:hypothetical protein C4573_04730 [Candidatus Woesearchaeota archaeon]|nr:MAG: hypothetical protein C4573_04730 [Candidatus Woesearchaeota archaeon]